MKVIKVPYNRDTVLEDVKAVIKYPCLIKVFHMVPPRYSNSNQKELEASHHEWGSGTYGHQSSEYLEPALYLDVDPWYYPATEVHIEVFDEEEYVKRVLGKGTMRNPEWDEMSFEERCKAPVSVLATEDHIRSYYKQIHPKGYVSKNIS